jgi:cell division protein FtsB
MTYNFNKYNKKVHPISNNYIDNEASITGNYNFPLFCINTGQKDYSDMSFKKARIVMENLFPESTKYELLNQTEIPSIAYEIISKMDTEINNKTKEINNLKKIKSDEKMKEELEQLKKELEKYKKENEGLKRENDSLRMEIKLLNRDKESLKLKIKEAEKERDFVENYGKDEHINNLVNLYRGNQEKEKVIEKLKYEKEIKDNYFIERITYFKRELYDKNNIINNLKINNEKLRMILNIIFYLFVIVILLISIYFVHKKIKTVSQNNNKDEDEDENDKLNNDIQKEEKKDSFQVMEMKEIIN